jgi:hypothetical protein
MRTAFTLVIEHDNDLSSTDVEGRLVKLLGAVDMPVQSCLVRPEPSRREHEQLMRQSVDHRRTTQ